MFFFFSFFGMSCVMAVHIFYGSISWHILPVEGRIFLSLMV